MTRTYTGWDYIIHSVPGYPAPDYVEPTPPAPEVIPAVWDESIPSVCVDGANVNISTFNATPSGGTYSGPGIVGTSFNPSTAGVGTITLTYTLASGEADTNTIVVNPLPTIVLDFPSLGSPLPFVAGSTIYEWRPAIDLAPTATPAGGSFSGTGMTGSTFNPTTAGLGTHTIAYAYTDGNTCAATASSIIEVITHPPTLPPPPGGPVQPGLPPFDDPISPGLPDFTPYYDDLMRADQYAQTVFMAEFNPDPGEDPEEGGGIPGGGFFVPGEDPEEGGGGVPGFGGGALADSHYALDDANPYAFDFVFSKVNEDRFTFSISASPRVIGSTYNEHLAQAIAVYDWDSGSNQWVKRD